MAYWPSVIIKMQRSAI